VRWSWAFLPWLVSLRRTRSALRFPATTNTLADVGKRISVSMRWIAATGSWNFLVNRVVPDRWYVPANLGAATLAAAAAPRGRARTDVRWVAAGAGVGVVGVVAAERLSATSHLFDDARADPDRLAWEVLVRIPLGTVALEEALFRHALPRVIGEPAAAILFGLWHVLPTLDTLDINGVADTGTRRTALIAGVAATTAAALPLSWLRRRGGLLAPMATHWAVNATAYAVASRRLTARR
jgi:membrane protease YdiL (CAAX protease family)